MGTMVSQITGLTFVYSTVIQAQIKENIKAPRHWPLCGEFTGDRWIPRTNGQERGKCFHLMTSSWCSSEQFGSRLCVWYLRKYIGTILPRGTAGSCFEARWQVVCLNVLLCSEKKWSHIMRFVVDFIYCSATYHWALCVLVTYVCYTVNPSFSRYSCCDIFLGVNAF